jgi:hypothetical protein
MQDLEKRRKFSPILKQGIGSIMSSPRDTCEINRDIRQISLLCHWEINEPQKMLNYILEQGWPGGDFIQSISEK